VTARRRPARLTLRERARAARTRRRERAGVPVVGARVWHRVTGPAVVGEVIASLNYGSVVEVRWSDGTTYPDFAHEFRLV
jgi:L-amino acid N-acyltransferase YncA